jgi:hypothetical protein
MSPKIRKPPKATEMIDNQIRNEERNVALEMQKCLTASSIGEEIEDNACLSRLGSALTYLVMAHLQLDSRWSHKTRWLDGIEWKSLSRYEPRAMQGKGTIWWGRRIEPAASLVGVEFQTQLRLSVSRNYPRINYRLSFESESVLYSIRN